MKNQAVEKPLPVLTICGDPGGARALAPVVAAMHRRRGQIVHSLVYGQAVGIWRDLGLPAQPLNPETTPAQALSLLRREPVSLVLTATSANGFDLEKTFIAAAHQLDRPSLAVLDFWSNYRRRFADSKGDLVYLPDKIAIMDEQAKMEMEAAGFPSQRLVITGQPALDDLAASSRRFLTTWREAWRVNLGLHPEDRLILFCSQPLTALNGGDPGNPDHDALNEKDVLELVIQALDNLAERHRQDLVLLVRPHPREEVGDFASIAARRVRVLVSAAGTGREVVQAVDLVLGMTSILLLEACLLGAPVISLQPGQQGLDPLPSNRFGWSQAVYQARYAEAAIEELLFNDEQIARRKAVLKRISWPGGASRRVLDLLHRLQKNHQGAET